MRLKGLQEYKRRGIVPLAGLVLALYYFFVFAPLERSSEELNAPLRQAWQQLAGSLTLSNAMALDFLHITNQLSETRQALALLENARQQVTARLEPGAAVRARLSGPFQLVEYENERSKEMEELAQAAKAQQVTVDAAVFAGFPGHTADVQQPALLWAALSMVDNLLTVALNARISALHTLEVPLVLTSVPAADGMGRWTEIPIQVEFTAPATNAVRLLRSLPLRGEEIRAAGLPEGRADKPPLFIERLMLKKQSPEKPDEVQVLLRVVGFVFRE